MSSLDPKRTIAELRELHALTRNPDTNGAMRVAWTDTWLRARAWLRDKTAGLPITVQDDAAGNTWYTLPGKSKTALLIGGHMDSVPNGGWLDGCLNVLAGIEVLRRINDEYNGTPPITVSVVDWADEEGARFGRSLLGSSACAGTMDPEVDRNKKDKDGITIEEAMRRCGFDIDQAHKANKLLKHAGAYLELHIEQGPVLESMKLPLGTVLGTCGVERWSIRFTGQAAHSGSTPMNARKDALACAAKFELEIREIAIRHGGVCTVGSVITRPGIVTAVVGECDITLDQRHINARSLAKMHKEARAAATRFAKEEKCGVSWSRIWQIEPIPFNKTLLGFCDEANIAISGKTHRLPSGPLHDAAEISRAGVPTVMMFVQSLRGISHNPIEDTKEKHLDMCVRSLDMLASRTMAWLAQA
jgi:beta-ureidopropionase / N-carbamoyl-L-amino-acid hydrolase